MTIQPTLFTYSLKYVFLYKKVQTPKPNQLPKSIAYYSPEINSASLASSLLASGRAATERKPSFWTLRPNRHFRPFCSQRESLSWTAAVLAAGARRSCAGVRLTPTLLSGMGQARAMSRPTARTVRLRSMRSQGTL